MQKVEATAPSTGRLITRKQAAQMLNVSDRTIDRMIEKGTFQRAKFGTNMQSGVRIKLAEVEAFIQQCSLSQ